MDYTYRRFYCHFCFKDMLFKKQKPNESYQCVGCGAWHMDNPDSTIMKHPDIKSERRESMKQLVYDTGYNKGWDDAMQYMADNDNDNDGGEYPYLPGECKCGIEPTLYIDNGMYLLTCSRCNKGTDKYPNEIMAYDAWEKIRKV